MASSTGMKVSSLNNWFTTEVQHMMNHLRQKNLIMQIEAIQKLENIFTTPVVTDVNINEVYGFGDCKKPLHDSASLIQDIVHQQLVNLLHQASEVASTRNSRFISIEDIVFLMRKDKVKLRRLLRYMKVKDTKAMLLRSVGTEDNEEIGENSDKPPAPSVPTYKRRKVCYDFLSSIDQTGELVALFDDETEDEIKHERLMRAELQSRNLDTNSYKEFCEARQAGFSRKYKFQRFKEWIMAGINLDIKPNLHALEVVSYLAYETVAEIVDLALLVKQDSRSCINDPMIKNTPQLCQNYHNAGDLVTGTNKTSSLGVLGSPTSAHVSPPSTPSTPSIQSNTLPPSLTSTNTVTTPSTISNTKTKSKKRRKSGQIMNIESQGDQVITPSDIQEAIRRYSGKIGPFVSSMKVSGMSPKHKLLCI